MICGPQITLVSKMPCGANANPKICVTPNANPKICVGHVDLMLIVLISFALVTQCEPSFQWNMGYRNMVILIGKGPTEAKYGPSGGRG